MFSARKVSSHTDLLWNFNCQVPLFAFEVISLVCITETNNIDILLSELFHLPLFRIQSAVVICLNVKITLHWSVGILSGCRVNGFVLSREEELFIFFSLSGFYSLRFLLCQPVRWATHGRAAKAVIRLIVVYISSNSKWHRSMKRKALY